MTPVFEGFFLSNCPYFMPKLDLIDLLFLQKKNWFVSITFSGQILGPKLGLIFHENVLFNGF